MADTTLRLECDTESGTIELTHGRALLGGTYTVQLVVDNNELSKDADAAYRASFFCYENQTQPLFLGTILQELEDVEPSEQDRREISFSVRELVDAFRPSARVWETSIPVHVYLHKALPDAEEPLYKPTGIVAEGRIRLDWSPILAEYVTGAPTAHVGPTGPQGAAGEKGKDGETYTPQLREGEDGEVYLDFVCGDRTVVGEVSIKGQQGEQGPRGEIGRRGPQGPRGEQGAPGVGIVYIDINETTLDTGLKGSEITIHLTDDSRHSFTVYNGIGAKGEKGEQGEKGDKGDMGESSFDVAKRAGFSGTAKEWVSIITSLPEAIRAQGSTIVATMDELNRIVREMRESVKVCEDSVRTCNDKSAGANESASYASVYAERARIYAEGGGTLPALPGGVTLPAVVRSARSYSVDAKEFRDEAETARMLAKGHADRAEESAKSASESAEQASTSATNAKTSENKAKEYAEQAASGNKDLERILDEDVTYFDVMGALKTAYPSWDMSQTIVTAMATTANGNHVTLVKRGKNNWDIVIFSQSGEPLAYKNIGAEGGNHYYEDFNNYLVQTATDFKLFCENGAVYTIIETSATAITISDKATLNFNGLATVLPAQPQNKNLCQFVIGDLAVLHSMVVQISTLKVVQILPSGITTTRQSLADASATVWVTLADGTVNKATIGNDGLLAFTEQTGAKGYQVFDDKAGGLLLAKIEAVSVRLWIFTFVNNSTSISYGYPYLITPLSFVSRGNKIVALTMCGHFLLIRANFEIVSNAYLAFKMATRVIQSGMTPARFDCQFLGVDTTGMWVKPMTTKTAYGARVTGEVVRIKW